MTCKLSFSRLILLSAVFSMLVLGLGAGCGYNIGTFAHPQIKSIAIAPVVNDTLSPFVASEMRGVLCEQFMTDGSLKVKQQDEADCILYCRVTNVVITENAQIGYDDQKNYRASEWKVDITAEFSVIIPTRKTPLVSMRTVNGTALFQAFGDPASMRSRGIRMACRDASEMIVEYTTEAW